MVCFGQYFPKYKETENAPETKSLKHKLSDIKI